MPAVLFYTLVHFGQAGYVLTFLPALVILLAACSSWAVAAGSERLRRARRRCAPPPRRAAPGADQRPAFFVSARPLPRDFDAARRAPGCWRARDEFFDWIFSRTAAALREHEAVVRTFVDTIRGLYEPEDTALITELGNPRSYPWLRHAMFYLPEYPIYQAARRAHAARLLRAAIRRAMIPAPGTRSGCRRASRRLVWFVDHWDPATPRPDGLREIELPYGRYLYVLPLGRTPVEYAGYTFVARRLGDAGAARSTVAASPSSRSLLAARALPARERQLAGALARAFPLDDSWIHLHFARNLAEGAGFSYNPGVPVPGPPRRSGRSRSPARSRCSAAVRGLAKVLGIAATLGDRVARRPPRRCLDRRRDRALLASVLVAWPGRSCGARSRAWKSRSRPCS